MAIEKLPDLSEVAKLTPDASITERVDGLQVLGIFAHSLAVEQGAEYRVDQVRLDSGPHASSDYYAETTTIRMPFDMVEAVKGSRTMSLRKRIGTRIVDSLARAADPSTHAVLEIKVHEYTERISGSTGHELPTGCMVANIEIGAGHTIGGVLGSDTQTMGALIAETPTVEQVWSGEVAPDAVVLSATAERFDKLGNGEFPFIK